MYRGTPRRFHYNIPHHVSLPMECIAIIYPKQCVDGTLTSRAIVNGGLITLFARVIPGFDETRYQPALGTTLMDYAYLAHLHWLDWGGDTYRWRINGMLSIELPNPLAKIEPGQPHYHLAIAGSDFLPLSHRYPSVPTIVTQPISRISLLPLMLPSPHIMLLLPLLIFKR